MKTRDGSLSGDDGTPLCRTIQGSGRYRSRARNGWRLLSLLPIIASFLQVGSIIPTSAGLDRQIFIRVNQLGYSPGDPKSAMAFSRESLPQKFRVIDANTHAVAFDGTSRPIAGR